MGSVSKAVFFAFMSLLFAGYCLGEVSFAKLGAPLPMAPSANGLRPPLFVTEFFILVLLLLVVLGGRSSWREFQLRLPSPLFTLTLLLLNLGLGRAFLDLRGAPLLVIRNSAFIWYLAIPLAISLIPVSAEAWDRWMRGLLWIPLLGLAWSIVFPWTVRPGDLPPDTPFHEFARVHWSMGVGVYGSLFLAAVGEHRGPKGWLPFLLAGAALGFELTAKVTRTNLLGILITFSALIIFHYFRRPIPRSLKTNGIVFLLAISVNFSLVKTFGPKMELLLAPQPATSQQWHLWHNPFVKSEITAAGMEKFRLYMWEDAWSQFSRAPWFGIGFQEQVVFRVYNGEPWGFFPNDGRHTSPPSSPISGPHNSYLNALARMGVLGAGFFLLHLAALVVLIRNQLAGAAWVLGAGILYASFNVGLEGPGRSWPLLVALGVALRCPHKWNLSKRLPPE